MGLCYFHCFGPDVLGLAGTKVTLHRSPFVLSFGCVAKKSGVGKTIIVWLLLNSDYKRKAFAFFPTALLFPDSSEYE